jgi:hypothetical protein
LVPVAKLAEQEAAQLTPGGTLLTVPLPEPAMVREIRGVGSDPGVCCVPESSGHAVTSNASPAHSRRLGRPANVATRTLIDRPQYKANQSQICRGVWQVLQVTARQN